jgi:hypothetical protein
MRKFRVILPILIPIIIFGALYIFLIKGKSGDYSEVQFAPRSEFYNKKFGYKNAYLTNDISKEGSITNVRVNKMPGASEPVIVTNKNKAIFVFCNDYQNNKNATMYFSIDDGLNWEKDAVPLSDNSENVFYADPFATTDENGNVYFTAIETDNSSKNKIIYNKYDIYQKKWFDKAVIVDEDKNSNAKFDKPKAIYKNNELIIAYTKKDEDGESLWIAKINNDGKIAKMKIAKGEIQSVSISKALNGNFYCVYLEDRTDLFIKSSADNGNTWSDEKQITELEMPGRKVNNQPVIKFGNNLGIRVNSDPQVAIHNNDIYVVFCAKGANDNSDIYFAKADLNNLNFTSPIKVSADNTNTDQFLPALSVDENGMLYVTYQDSREDNMNVLVNTYCSYSDNGGATFKDVKLSTKDFNPYDIVINGIYLGDYNSSVITNGNLISIWTDGRNKNFDIYASIVPLNTLQ